LTNQQQQIIMASTNTTTASRLAIGNAPKDIAEAAEEIVSTLERVYSSNERLSVDKCVDDGDTWRINLCEEGRDDGVTVSDRTIENNLGRHDVSLDHMLAHHTGKVSIHLVEDA
jgi:hypothetical protein